MRIGEAIGCRPLGETIGNTMQRIHTVCVYCGSSIRIADHYKQITQQFGRILAAEGCQLVYGGGRVGLMGLLADAVLAAEGRVIGIIPEHIQALEVDHSGLTELHIVDSMHTRKRMMFERSDAFVALPGGLGTLDELVEIMTWRQLGLHDKPLVMVNTEHYWLPFLSLLEHMIEAGFCRPEHRALIRVVESVDEVMDALHAAPEPAISVQTKWL